jgi:CHASE3 domain sensor protein
LGLGLLKFCLEHSDGNVGDTNLENYQRDSEDYKWLMEALNNLESDSQRMKKLVDSLNSNITVQEMKFALEGIQYFVEDLDLANDLIKVNGLSTIVRLILHDDADIRYWIAWILASLTQNNQTTQLALVKLDVLNLLCSAIQKETHDQARDKQLYALSSLMSGNQELMNNFVDTFNGINYLVSMTLSKIPSTQFKSLWFLYKLLTSRPDLNIKKAKENQQLLNNLLYVIKETPKSESLERAIHILLLCIKNDVEAKKKCVALGFPALLKERESKAEEDQKNLLVELHKQLS